MEESEAPSTLPSPSSEGQLTPGIYTAETIGFGGKYKVSVEVSEDQILSIQVSDHAETIGIGTVALDYVKENILEHQSINVDALSGATFSSKSLKAGVRDALTQAGASEDSFNEDAHINIQSPVSLSEFNQDVIVVGAGWAGMMASLEASEAGAKVLLIEKTSHLGGAGTYSGARISGAQTSIQEKAGIKDSPDLYFEYLKEQAATLGTFNEELARTYCECSGPTVERLMSQWGFEFDPQPTYTYDPENVDRTYPGIGGGMGFTIHFNDLINERVKDGSIYVLRDTEVTNLIMENDSVVGVKTASDTQVDEPFYADSVILATGGYSHNSELLHQGFERVGTSTVATSTGDGFVMADEVGAALVNMEYSKCDPGMLDLGSFDMIWQANPLIPGELWIDINGKRFVDETSLNIEGKSLQWYNAEKNTVYLLLTEAMISEENPILSRTAYMFPDVENKEFERQVESGKAIFKADSIEELAEKMDVDTANLKATVQQYNEDAAAGKDSVFGRTENLIPFEDGPFYAIETIPSVLCSFGGVSINAQSEVLREDGTVISGLYAAGEIIGASNFTGAAPFSGGFLGMCVTFGRIAGTSAAEHALKMN